MIEILLIIFLARRIGNIAVRKGHKRGPNIIFFVVMWIAGEIIGGLSGAFLTKGHVLSTYLMALIGAAVGAIIAFRVVNSLEDLNNDDSDMITIEVDE